MWLHAKGVLQIDLRGLGKYREGQKKVHCVFVALEKVREWVP